MLEEVGSPLFKENPRIPPVVLTSRFMDCSMAISAAVDVKGLRCDRRTVQHPELDILDSYMSGWVVGILDISTQ